jgi:hypothetical protein
MKTYTHMSAVKKIFKLATAANDFLVASGAGVFVKKTLAEVQAILGLGSWAAYSPLISSSVGAFSVATSSGRWIRRGNTVFFYLSVSVTNIGTASGLFYITLPVTAVQAGIPCAWGQEVSATGVMLQATTSPDGTKMSIRKYDASVPLVNGYTYSLTGFYEAS